MTRGLLRDDKEYLEVLKELSTVASAAQMRSLFVIILTHCVSEKNPLLLWDTYKYSMSDDFKHKRISDHVDSSSSPDPLNSQTKITTC